LLRSIPNKRELLATGLTQTGIIGLLERTLVNWQPGLLVLTYHRIAEPSGDLFYDPVISASPESFRTQVAWLANRFRIITLDELISQLEDQAPWREPVLLLTFDDGYKDNFDVGMPILRELGIPATFFIPTGFLDNSRLPWWDHIAYVLKRTTVHRLLLKMSPQCTEASLTLALDTMPRALAIMVIIRAFLDETISDPVWFLDQLDVQAEVSVDSQDLGRSLFMSWDHVRQLVALGAQWTIGSHAHTHCRLASLENNAQRYELAESKRILEAHIRQPIRALAYPYGWPGTYNALTRACAGETGYSVAFTSRVGVNRFGKIHRFEVKRLGIGSADSIRLLRARMAFHGAFGRSIL
jgi:peptidoglycan/xylan/chitin deacetylase (PgdA/CDA1 family)